MSDCILHPCVMLQSDTDDTVGENRICMMPDSEAATHRAPIRRTSTPGAPTPGTPTTEAHRIVVVGMPLSGKTSVYQWLSKRFEGGIDCPKFGANGSALTPDMCPQSRVGHPKFGFASLYELDAEIEKDAGKSIPEIFAEEGEAGFRIRERKVLLRLLMFHETLKEQISIVFAGGGAVQSPETIEILKRFDRIVYLRTSLSALLLRMSDEEVRIRPLFRTDSPREALERLYKMRTRRYEELATDIMDTDERSVAEVSNELMKLVQKTTSKSEIRNSRVETSLKSENGK